MESIRHKDEKLNSAGILCLRSRGANIAFGTSAAIAAILLFTDLILFGVNELDLNEAGKSLQKAKEFRNEDAQNQLNDRYNVDLSMREYTLFTASVLAFISLTCVTMYCVSRFFTRKADRIQTDIAQLQNNITAEKNKIDNIENNCEKSVKRFLV